MATYDVRNEDNARIDTIVFSDEVAAEYAYVACKIHKDDDYHDMISIKDGCDDYIRIASKENAQNLIKALNKAIELGWLE